MDKSLSFWHSVVVLTDADCCKTDSNILSLKDIQAICKNAEMILISAYDGGQDMPEIRNWKWGGS